MEDIDFKPHMPAVDVWPDMEQTFLLAREVADHPDDLNVVVVTPGHRLFVPIPVTRLDSKPFKQIPLGGLVDLSSGFGKKTISVIAMTEVSVGLIDRCRPDAPPYTGSQAIPFFGYLMVLGSLGHSVLIFEGHSSTLAMGCHDAEILIVDGGMIPFLQSGWLAVARASMREQGKVMIFHRDQTIQTC